MPTKKPTMVPKTTPAARWMRESSHWSAQAGPSSAMEVDSPVKELSMIHMKHGHKHKRSAGPEVKEQDESEEYEGIEDEEDDDSDVQLAKAKRVRKPTIQGNGRYYKPPCQCCVKRRACCKQQEQLVWENEDGIYMRDRIREEAKHSSTNTSPKIGPLIKKTKG